MQVGDKKLVVQRASVGAKGVQVAVSVFLGNVHWSVRMSKA